MASGVESFDAFAFVEKLTSLSKFLLSALESIHLCAHGQRRTTGLVTLTRESGSPKEECSSPDFYVKGSQVGIYLEHFEWSVLGLTLQLGKGTN